MAFAGSYDVPMLNFEEANPLVTGAYRAMDQGQNFAKNAYGNRVLQAQAEYAPLMQKADIGQKLAEMYYSPYRYIGAYIGNQARAQGAANHQLQNYQAYLRSPMGQKYLSENGLTTEQAMNSAMKDMDTSFNSGGALGYMPGLTPGFPGANGMNPNNMMSGINEIAAQSGYPDFMPGMGGQPQGQPSLNPQQMNGLSSAMSGGGIGGSSYNPNEDYGQNGQPGAPQPLPAPNIPPQNLAQAAQGPTDGSGMTANPQAQAQPDNSVLSSEAMAASGMTDPTYRAAYTKHIGDATNLSSKAAQTLNLLDEFSNSYDQANAGGYTGPISGKVGTDTGLIASIKNKEDPKAFEGSQNASRTANIVAANLADINKYGKGTDFQLQNWVTNKPTLSLTPGAEQTQVGQLKSQLKRVAEMGNFYGAGVAAGMPQDKLDTAWSKYMNDKPYWDSKENKEVNANAWQDYIQGPNRDAALKQYYTPPQEVQQAPAMPGKGAPAQGAQQQSNAPMVKNIGGKNYTKVNGQWYQQP